MSLPTVINVLKCWAQQKQIPPGMAVHNPMIPTIITGLPANTRHQLGVSRPSTERQHALATHRHWVAPRGCALTGRVHYPWLCNTASPAAAEVFVGLLCLVRKPAVCTFSSSYKQNPSFSFQQTSHKASHSSKLTRAYPHKPASTQPHTKQDMSLSLSFQNPQDPMPNKPSRVNFTC